MKNGHFRISLTPWCASHRRVELCGVHPTAEPTSVVCIILWSQGYQLSQKTPRFASHCGVKLQGVLPTAESSSKVCITLCSQALQCATYSRVKLSSSTVYITPWSQTAHWGVKIKIFMSLWLFLKGQSREFLVGVNCIM